MIVARISLRSVTRRALGIALAITAPTWSAADAQWIRVPAPGIPRTGDGTPNLEAPLPRTPDGRPDVSGVWQRVVPPEVARAARTALTDQNLQLLLPPGETVPFHPWAAALVKQRFATDGAGSP